MEDVFVLILSAVTFIELHTLDSKQRRGKLNCNTLPFGYSGSVKIMTSVLVKVTVSLRSAK